MLTFGLAAITRWVGVWVYVWVWGCVMGGCVKCVWTCCLVNLHNYSDLLTVVILYIINPCCPTPTAPPRVPGPWPLRHGLHYEVLSRGERWGAAETIARTIRTHWKTTGTRISLHIFDPILYQKLKTLWQKKPTSTLFSGARHRARLCTVLGTTNCLLGKISQCSQREDKAQKLRKPDLISSLKFLQKIVKLRPLVCTLVIVLTLFIHVCMYRRSWLRSAHTFIGKKYINEVCLS